MAKYPWMKLFPSDLDRDCRCLTLSSFGAWVRIFMDLHFYKGERSLSLDSWSRVISATIPQTALALQEIIRAGVCDSNVSADVLPTKTDAFIMIRCRRIAREFKLRQTHNLRQQKYSNKRSNDAQNDASMTVQMSEAKKTDAKTPYIPHQNSGNGNGGMSVDSMFLILWESYPAKRRTKREESLKNFRTLNPNKALFQEILAAVDQLKLSEDWKKENGRWIPGIAKWISDKGWESVEVNIQCGVCSQIGVVVRDGESILPWSLERESKHGLPFEVCPECHGKNRINVPGLPNVRFPHKEG